MDTKNIDYIKRINALCEIVYIETLKNNPDIIKEINKLYDVLDGVNTYINKSTYGDSAPQCLIIPFALPEIESSIYLALHGNYHIAISLFRIILDTSLRQLYFEDDVPSEIEWLENPEKFKFKKGLDLVGEFFLWYYATYFDYHTGFQKEIRKMKNELNLYIHPGGEGFRQVYSKKGIPTIATTVYSEELLKRWLKYYKFIIKFLCVGPLLMEHAFIHSKKFTKYLKPFISKFKEEWDLINKASMFFEYYYDKTSKLSQISKEIKLDLIKEIKKFDEKDSSLKQYAK